jgi:hypothetical protein
MHAARWDYRAAWSFAPDDHGLVRRAVGCARPDRRMQPRADIAHVFILAEESVCRLRTPGPRCGVYVVTARNAQIQGQAILKALNQASGEPQAGVSVCSRTLSEHDASL